MDNEQSAPITVKVGQKWRERNGHTNTDRVVQVVEVMDNGKVKIRHKDKITEASLRRFNQKSGGYVLERDVP